MIRTIQERLVSMLQHSGLSVVFWAEALLTAAHIIHMSPKRRLRLQVPRELWTESKSYYHKLRIFGCEAYTLIPKEDHCKLEPRSRKCVLLGYGLDGEIGYRLYDLENIEIIRSLDIVFNETAMYKMVKSPIEV